MNNLRFVLASQWGVFVPSPAYWLLLEDLALDAASKRQWYYLLKDFKGTSPEFLRSRIHDWVGWMKVCCSREREFVQLRTVEDSCRAAVPLSCGQHVCPDEQASNHKTNYRYSLDQLVRLYSRLDYQPEVLRVVIVPPVELQQYLARNPALFRRLVYRWFDCIFSQGGRFEPLVECALHFHHTKAPLKGLYLHFDGNMFNLAVDNLSGEIVKFDIRKVDFATCQRVFMDILRQVFPKMRADKCVIHVGDEGRTRKGWAHVEQALKYSSRPAQRDVLDFLKGHSVPEDMDKEFAKFLLFGKNRKTLIWTSFMAASVRRKSFDSLHVQMETKSQFERRVHRMECPHGYFFHYDWDSGSLSIDQVAELGLSIVRRIVDPPPWEVALV